MIIFELRHQFFNLQMLINYLKTPISISASNNIFLFWQETIAVLLFGNNKNLATIFIFLFLILTVIFGKKLSALEKLCLTQILIVIIFTIIFRRDLRPPMILIAHYGLASLFQYLFLPLTIFAVSCLVPC